MIFKLLEAAQGRRERINGYELVPLVRAERIFNGELLERSEDKEGQSTTSGNISIQYPQR